MKNREVLNFGYGLNGLRKELKGRLFTHAVVLNKQKIEGHLKALDAARKPNEKMQEYIDKFEKLKKEHVKKDENGNPVIKQGVDHITGEDIFFYDIPANNDPNSKFIKTRNKLMEEYKEAIDEHNKMIQEWSDKLLDKDSDFVPTMIDLNDVPDEIDTHEMENIIYMINE